MLRYKLVKLTRRIRMLLNGNKEVNREHYLFTLSNPLTPKEIWERLWKCGWGYNFLSTAYRHQIYTMRKLAPPRHQYHIRFYKNGDVTGHFEVENINFPLEHLDGVELRAFNQREKNALKRELEII